MVLRDPGTLAPDQLRAAARNWGFFLFAGIVSVVFGFVVLSLTVETVWTLAIFVGIWLIFTGIDELIVAGKAMEYKWLYLVGGVLSIIAGIVCLVWPDSTLLVISIFIAWFLLFRGVFDLVVALTNTHADYWWVLLVRGLVEILLGLWAIADGAELALFVVLVGVGAIVYGVVEIFASMRLREINKASPA
ncbi:MAG: HdeD family acid-resistance protein [Acidimicrobiia bacterium]